MSLATVLVEGINLQLDYANAPRRHCISAGCKL